MERRFLIVAADGKVREALAADLRKAGRSVTLAENGSEAFRVVQAMAVDSVLVESHLPDMSGEELRGKILETRPEARVIVITSFNLVRNTPGVLRFGEDDYLLQADQLLELVQPPDTVETEGAAESIEQTNLGLLQVIDVLVGLLEIEYELFSSASHRAMKLARATAEEMNAGDDIVREVMLGTLLRDVGKAAIEHDSSDPATADLGENELVERHVTASLRLFEHIDFHWKVLPVIRHHHERYNGSGAPDGLRGREIPMGCPHRIRGRCVRRR